MPAWKTSGMGQRVQIFEVFYPMFIIVCNKPVLKHLKVVKGPFGAAKI